MSDHRKLALAEGPVSGQPEGSVVVAHAPPGAAHLVVGTRGVGHTVGGIRWSLPGTIQVNSRVCEASQPSNCP
jgi:hypothetical protein